MDERTHAGISTFSKVLAALVIIGALNWGLIGFFQWNLVAALFGGDVRPDSSGLSQVIYIAVGLAGLALAFTFPWSGKRVSSGTTTERRRIGPREEVHP
jgi:uncharacterized protein